MTLAVLGATAGAAEASHGGVFIPPLEVELGHAIAGAADGGTLESTQLLVGISWASIYPRPTPIDVSVGVICSMYPAPTVAAARTAGPPPAADVDSGGYVDVAVRTASGPHWRMWAGARGELIDQGERSALGVAARASMELWAPTVGGDSHGPGIAMFLGTVAVSAWAEAGVREQPRGVASFVAAGLGMRIPLIIAGQ